MLAERREKKKVIGDGTRAFARAPFNLEPPRRRKQTTGGAHTHTHTARVQAEAGVVSVRRPSF